MYGERPSLPPLAAVRLFVPGLPLYPCRSQRGFAGEGVQDGALTPAVCSLLARSRLLGKDPGSPPAWPWARFGNERGGCVFRRLSPEPQLRSCLLAAEPSASVNQQHPLNRFLANSTSAPERGDGSATLQPNPSASPSLPRPHGLHGSALCRWETRSPPGRVRAEQQTDGSSHSCKASCEAHRRHRLCLRTCHRAGGISPPPYLAVAGAARGHWCPRRMRC